MILPFSTQQVFGVIVILDFTKEDTFFSLLDVTYLVLPLSRTPFSPKSISPKQSMNMNLSPHKDVINTLI